MSNYIILPKANITNIYNDLIITINRVKATAGTIFHLYIMAMGNAPQAVSMELQKEYAERYDWLVKEFTDRVFTFMTSFL